MSVVSLSTYKVVFLRTMPPIDRKTRTQQVLHGVIWQKTSVNNPQEIQNVTISIGNVSSCTQYFLEPKSNVRH
jgi:hypothetical protein